MLSDKRHLKCIHKVVKCKRKPENIISFWRLIIFYYSLQIISEIMDKLQDTSLLKTFN